MSKHAISVFDLTLNIQTNTFETVKGVLEEWCKHWVFQKEKGEVTGYVHWQIRFSLKKKRRIQEIAPRLAIAGLKFHDTALTPTSTAGLKTGFSYVTKADTRLEGPWKDTDVEKVLTKCVAYLDKNGLDPWMQEIKDIWSEWDRRHIDVFVDTKGNSGKTTFEDWAEYHEHAFSLWYDPNIQRMMESAHANAGRPVYTIGLPRALNKKEMNDFWNFVERLKDGRTQDGRYSAKRKRMERPNVWIFTNELPDLGEMSPDRWRFWQIDDETGGLCAIDEFTE